MQTRPTADRGPCAGWLPCGGQAILRIVDASRGRPPVSPAELLVAVHKLEPARDGVSLRKVMDAMQVCFGMKEVYKQDVLAVVLQQLLDLPTLPLLAMRTVRPAFAAT